MDWGLFHTNEKGMRFLRSKLFYPKWFYYWAMFSNFVLRFFWLITFLPNTSMKENLPNAQIMLFCLTLLECLRRTQWALLRVENENVNNFEKYRTFLEVPVAKNMREEEHVEEENIDDSHFNPKK